MKYNNLNEYFSKLYVINLNRRPDRYEEVKVEFDKINAKVERVEAVDGNTLPPTDNKPGNRGLIATNIKILEDAIKNEYDNILIFEDDAVFVDNFNKLFNEKILALPENWDILYLGGNHILHVPGFELITGDKNFKVTKENYKTLNHELSKTPCTYCTHAVGINSKIYERVLNALKNGSQPIDNLYYQLQNGGACNSYTFLPSLVTQKASFSDIENLYLDYNKVPQVNF